MVFFTAIIIVCILYFLQADGLIYVTIIALVAELINIFLAQAMAKSSEKKLEDKYNQMADIYKKRIMDKEKTISEFEKVQEESVRRLFKANTQIKEYEIKLGIETDEQGNTTEQQETPNEKSDKTAAGKDKSDEKNGNQEFIDLPSGSNRKSTPP